MNDKPVNHPKVPEHWPHTRYYRTLVQQALTAKSLNHMTTYNTLMLQAETLLQHIRTTSPLQTEPPNAQRPPN